MEINNIGRHILGIDSVGQNKALALDGYLSRQLPHLKISSIDKKWENVFKNDSNFPNSYDLIISTIGRWNSEELLNIISRNRDLPPVLYGWLEPYAVAGHALLSIAGSGCLACQMNDLGHFCYAVSAFENSTLMTDSGGCTQYQQYGTAVLTPVAAMIVTTALDSFNNHFSDSFLRTWVSNEDHFKNVSAKINPIWKTQICEKGFSHLYETKWPSISRCDVCND